MSSMEIKLALAIVGLVVLVGGANSLVDPMKVAAQSSNGSPQPCCQDMWNPNWTHRDMWGPGHMGPGMRHRMARHWAFMHQGIPAEFRGAGNPHSPDAETIGKGRTLYQANCASCHGATGMGDGEAANALSPSPALLAYMIQMPMSVDEYMLWSISDGGAAFETDMPAFKDVLTKDEIWKIVTYMRAGFPAKKEPQ